MIQSAMLVALGFFAASFLAFLVAPGFYARAVRLTTERIKSSLPVSEAEIRADKDQIRAQYAVRVHQLEKEIEAGKLSAARQLIELNRRDVEITELNTKGHALQADLEENQNARRVLEQTINDRLPKLEQRLDEARRLLQARDREIAELASAGRTMEGVLEQARGINAQLEVENDRLRAAMAARQDRDRRRFGEPADESEFALQNELAALRAQSRDQTAQIDRLRLELTRARAAANAVAEQDAASGDGAGVEELAALRKAADEQAQQIERLNASLASAEAELAGLGKAGRSGETSAQTRIKELSEALREREEEAEHMATLLKAHEAERQAAAKSGGRETKADLRGRAEALQTRLEHEMGVSERLRVELAAANERAARQAAHYVSEMKRLGSGSLAQRAASSVDESRATGSRRLQLEAAREKYSAAHANGNGAGPDGAAANGSDGKSDGKKVARASIKAPGSRSQATVTPIRDGEQTARPERKGPSRERSKLLERLRSYE